MASVHLLPKLRGSCLPSFFQATHDLFGEDPMFLLSAEFLASWTADEEGSEDLSDVSVELLASRFSLAEANRIDWG